MDKHDLRDLYVNETGNQFPCDAAKYVDWLEEKIISTNSRIMATAKPCPLCLGDGELEK